MRPTPVSAALAALSLLIPILAWLPATGEEGPKAPKVVVDENLRRSCCEAEAVALAAGKGIAPGGILFRCRSPEGKGISIGDIFFLCEGSPDKIIAPGEGFFSRGDSNADGRVDVSDALAALAHLYLGTPAACPCAGDVNRDELLEVADVVVLLEGLFYGGISG